MPKEFMRAGSVVMDARQGPASEAVVGMQRPSVAAGLSDPGVVRTRNEDALVVEEVPGGWLLVVCDGMGGHRAGQLASRIGVEQIQEKLVASLARDGRADPRESLWDALVAANTAIRKNAATSPDVAGMGSTAVVLLVRAGQAYVAHVGDSRAYLLREGILGQLTADHTVVREMIEHGIISPEQAHGHSEAHRVSRALGLKEDLVPEVRGEPIAQRTGDTFLLCSDGLTDIVEDHEIAEILLLPAKDAAKALVARAVSRGAPDNVTVAVYQNGEPFVPWRRRALRFLSSHSVVGAAATAALLALLGLGLLIWFVHPQLTSPKTGSAIPAGEQPQPRRSARPPASATSRPPAPLMTAPRGTTLPSHGTSLKDAHGHATPPRDGLPSGTSSTPSPPTSVLPAGDQPQPSSDVSPDVLEVTTASESPRKGTLLQCDQDGATTLADPETKALYAKAIKAMQAARKAADGHDGGKALRHFKTARRLLGQAGEHSTDDGQKAALDEICEAKMYWLRQGILTLQFGIIMSNKSNCRHVLGTSKDLVQYLDMQPQERPVNVVEAVERCETEGGKP